MTQRSLAEAEQKLEAMLSFWDAMGEKGDEDKFWKLHDEALAAAGIPRHPNSREISFEDRPILAARDLDPIQRAIAERLATRPGLWLSTHAVPSAAWARRAWLGLDPPGVLFSAVDETSSASASAPTLFETGSRLVSSM